MRLSDSRLRLDCIDELASSRRIIDNNGRLEIEIGAMAQLNLFETEPATTAPAPPNPVFVRKHLNRLLNIARAAERMPWKQSDADSWATFFPRLAQSLPDGEGAALEIAFATELKRLRSVTG